MKHLIFLLLLLSFMTNADTPAGALAGKWEGFKKQGAHYSAIIISIEENGRGFYGYSLGGGAEGAMCFPINESTLKKKVGYYEQTNIVKQTEFILLFSVDLLGSLEALSIFVYDNKTGSMPFSWSLVSTDQEFINMPLKEACEIKVKNNTQ